MRRWIGRCAGRRFSPERTGRAAFRGANRRRPGSRRRTNDSQAHSAHSPRATSRERIRRAFSLSSACRSESSSPIRTRPRPASGPLRSMQSQASMEPSEETLRSSRAAPQPLRMHMLAAGAADQVLDVPDHGPTSKPSNSPAWTASNSLSKRRSGGHKTTRTALRSPVPDPPPGTASSPSPQRRSPGNGVRSRADDPDCGP